MNEKNIFEEHLEGKNILDEKNIFEDLDQGDQVHQGDQGGYHDE